MRLLGLSIVALGAMAACDNPNYPPTVPLEFEFRACLDDTDCTIVELGCCDECNGGAAVATRTDRADDAFDEYRQRGCGGLDCTQLACNPLVARCVNDLCVVDRSAREP